MKKILILFWVALICSPSIAQHHSKEILYAGTYSERESKGIYVFEFDRKNQSAVELQTVTGVESPTFLEIHPTKKYLYAVFRGKPDVNGIIVAYEIDQTSGKLTKINEQSTEGKNPCHVNVDPKGKLVYVSNYGSGNLTVYPVNTDGSLAKPSGIIQHTGSSINKERQKEPHAHSSIPSPTGDFIYTSDLGIDKIMIYKKDKNDKLQPAKIPFISTSPGSGPRHAAFSPNGKFLFSDEELSSAIASYKVNKDGSLDLIEHVTMLSKDTTAEGNAAADIHVSPNGKFVYASNRGQDNLVIYSINPSTGKLTYVGHERIQGKHPRNFLIDSNGEFIFVANRYTDNITIFKLDHTSGKLSFTGNKISIPGVSCIKQLILSQTK